MVHFPRECIINEAPSVYRTNRTAMATNTTNLINFVFDIANKLRGPTVHLSIAK